MSRITAPATAAAFALLIWLEQRRPLRASVEPKSRRFLRNLIFGAIGLATVQLVELPLMLPLASMVQERSWGLLHRVSLAHWLEVSLALVLLDYTLYLWHVLTHHVPLLWRFHLVHHVDLDLDASTALRFHLGELVLSLPWRAAQILAIGVDPAALLAWESVLVLSILFHHSNVELPYELERRLVRFVVTPRMHGIHHSTVQEETNSNWSSGLTLWDRLHGTLRLNVSQSEITVGVPPYRAAGQVGLVKLFVLPFATRCGPWPPQQRLRTGDRPAPRDALVP